MNATRGRPVWRHSVSAHTCDNLSSDAVSPIDADANTAGGQGGCPAATPAAAVIAPTTPVELPPLPTDLPSRPGSLPAVIAPTLDPNLTGTDMDAVVERLLSPQSKEQTDMSPVGDFDADVVVIGSGPGGYVAAIRAAQLGARTVCIEKQATEWGGTCLNWGCIPTKAMIASVERLHHVKTADVMGVIVQGEVGYDFTKIMERKQKVVATLRGGVSALLKSNHVRSMVGTARFVDAHTIEVAKEDGTTERITAQNTIIATGSVPILPPIPGLERNPNDPRGKSSNGIWTSDEAVYATECPKRMLVMGAGAVGLEFGYTFRGLGAEVTVVEIAPEILPTGDREISAELRKSLKKQGINILTSSKVTNVEHKESACVVTIESEGGKQTTLEVDVVLVGAGRKPYFEGLNLEAAGVKTVTEGPLSRRGVIVDEHLQTSQPNIYAIGDATGKQLLAHLASHMGIVAAENAMGHCVKMDYRAVPAPIYTSPEVASVGLSEEEAKAQGYDVMTGRFPFRPLGRAMALNEQEGMVKIVSERKYGELLGVHIVGPYATEMIHEGVIAIKLESTVEELMTAIHAHPTLSEAVGEAALDVKGDAIHKIKK
jgi:dihydrolipoamide dehydrogenase